MSEPKTLKLRTIIMVASMIALPLAAVVGVKVPSFSSTEKKWSGDTAPARPPLKSTTDRAITEKSTSPLGAQAVAASATTQPNSYPVSHVGGIAPLGESQPAVRPAGGAESSWSEPQTAAVAVAAPESQASVDSEFTHIQQRLRALGATHYVLATFGTTTEAYRFECRMATGHDANYSRHFEATDVEPIRAMRTVLADVEAWKSGRLP